MKVAHAHAHALQRANSDDLSNDNFDTVIVMTDPHDWFEALQGAVDAVVSADPNGAEVMEFDISKFISQKLSIFLFSLFSSVAFTGHN
jgi:hypothetical protein